MRYDVIVIGAGASGMMAAVTAAAGGANVCVLEAQSRPGKKLLATGNGKCNLTNYNISGECYRSDSASSSDIMKVIGKFDNHDVIDFFHSQGLLVRERDGYVYPYSEQASSVLDTLRRGLARYGVGLVCDTRVMKIRESSDSFAIEFSDSKGKIYNYICNKLIIASGSSAGGFTSDKDLDIIYGFIRDVGHHIIKPLPALVALTCGEKFFKEISGVRAKGTVKLYIGKKPAAADRGEIQFTDTGISGIPVFQISRYAAKALDKGGERIYAEIDFMPEYSEGQLVTYINNIKNNATDITDWNTGAFTNVLTGLVNKKLMGLIIRLSVGDIVKMASLLKSFRVTVTGSKGTVSGQVCQGGVSLGDLNIDSMESKYVKGLFFCGEILDVDGICGGYNLQWAWSSGHLAGISAIKK